MSARRRDEVPPPIYRYAPLGELKIYMVTEDELDVSARGSPGSVYLNFGLALVPVSAAFLITLLTTNIPNIPTLVFFICACLMCFLFGVLCLVLAWRNHISAQMIVARIKNRMPPPAEPADPGPPGEPPTGSPPI